MTHEILGLTLTGGGICPEQYDVFRGDKPIGYMRLRHGQFRAEYHRNGIKTTVYQSAPWGDGEFSCAERMLELTKATIAIIEAEQLAAALGLTE